METWNLVESLVEDAMELLEGEPLLGAKHGARGGPLQQRVDFVEERNARRHLRLTRFADLLRGTSRTPASTRLPRFSTARGSSAPGTCKERPVEKTTRTGSAARRTPGKSAAAGRTVPRLSSTPSCGGSKTARKTRKTRGMKTHQSETAGYE